MELVRQIIFVVCGAIFGSISRFLIGYYAVENFAISQTHWVTLGINIIGSFLLGGLMAYFADKQVSYNVELMLTVGFCGTFTTFSTFSVESIQLLKNGMILSFFTYVLASVLLGLMAAFLGWKFFTIN